MNETLLYCEALLDELRRSWFRINVGMNYSNEAMRWLSGPKHRGKIMVRDECRIEVTKRRNDCRDQKNVLISSSRDRALTRTSCSTTIKTMRWCRRWVDLIVKRRFLKRAVHWLLCNWLRHHYHHIISGRAPVQSSNYDIDGCLAEPSHGDIEGYVLISSSWRSIGWDQNNVRYIMVRPNQNNVVILSQYYYGSGECRIDVTKRRNDCRDMKKMCWYRHHGVITWRGSSSKRRSWKRAVHW
jgi:hypothetical protein